ncbi:hypothetical protein CKAH01_17786 [Colletotrichum kahawae]|uniref:Uncharacterized protein n=1 Tax=Colletotrichum kahawae TaxID=34407 RepID=A0AAE0D3V8_COLKA|nr:hypothetical protein CKAH01_17786 [Colletotrichum kahawae]
MWREAWSGKDIEGLELQVGNFDSRHAYGHCVILHMCLKLLLEPENVDWFFELPPDLQEDLRCLTLGQINEVGNWLQATLEDFDDYITRPYILCSTAIVLLQAEQMVRDSERRHSGQQDQSQSTVARRLGHTTAGTVHSTMLKHLRSWTNLEGMEVMRERLEILVDPDYSHRLWDRLSTLAVEKNQDEKGVGDREKIDGEEVDGEEVDGEDDEEGGSKDGGFAENEQRKRKQRMKRFKQAAGDIDDVIIYRCLMIILLFRTAPDSTEVLESGLWDMVLPMI